MMNMLEEFGLDVTTPDRYAAIELEHDERERIVELLETAAEYLEHPQTKEIPFALPSTAVAKGLRRLVDSLLEEAENWDAVSIEDEAQDWEPVTLEEGEAAYLKALLELGETE